MKSVLVVGAGPAGLVAAKSLLHRPGNPFKVTVFEAAQRVGGMWGVREGEDGYKCSPDMRTNLGRFTVAFSDLSWQAVNLETETVDSRRTKRTLPMFPNAHQVGRYLEEYAIRFIPKDVIFCNREVKSARLLSGHPATWSVSSRDKISQTLHEDQFDLLLVASGFFDQPDPSFSRANVSSTGSCPPIQHSAAFRDVATLTTGPGNIAVVGGGISGSEAAATAAFQISNARYAPRSPKPAWAQCKVYHVFDRPFYCLPRYIPQNPYDASLQDYIHAPDFLPVDLNLYNLSRRGDGEISASLGQVPPDKAKKGHDFIRSLLGGDQRELGKPELVYTPPQTAFPGYTGISDTYADFVRSGIIIPVQGRAQRLNSQGGHTTLEVSQESTWLKQYPGEDVDPIHDVVGIVEATGYQVHLDFLSEDVKQLLDYGGNCHRLPFLLSRGSIFNPSVPQIAFVGFYEGPYWGVMEMQARVVAQAWEGTLGYEMDTDITVSRQVREAINRRDLDVPQFWMMDYVGLVEEFARIAGTSRNDNAFEGQTGPAFPARYPASINAAAQEVTQEVASLLFQSQHGARFVAAAAFRAMQGTWSLQRKIDSRHPSSPGGTLNGTAQFHPRKPTSTDFQGEYLYIEEGTFTMDNGFSFSATRRYVYRYNETSDTISAWFVEEDGERVERIFTELEFQRPDSKQRGWIANGSHWCSPDTYKSSCEFRFRGASLDSFGITYDVSGPKKSYTMESWYHRPAL